MPVSQDIAESNQRETSRLRELVKRLSADDMNLQLKNGWTVKACLAHIAFWDRQRLCLLKRWASDDWCAGGYSGELFNEVLLPFLELLPSEQVVSIAIQTAEELDQLLLTLPDDFLAQALARPDKPYLDRGAHRGYHLDQIEQALSR